MKKIIQAVIGVACIVGGVTLIFYWWPHVVAFFQGVLGMVLAVTGLVVLTLLDSKNK